MTKKWSVNRIAALAVARRTELSLADRRVVLEALGLVRPGGSELVPDDTRMNSTSPIVASNQRRDSKLHSEDDIRRRPKTSNAPAGLQNPTW